jgi:hypothetical protein
VSLRRHRRSHERHTSTIRLRASSALPKMMPFVSLACQRRRGWDRFVTPAADTHSHMTMTRKDILSVALEELRVLMILLPSVPDDQHDDLIEQIRLAIAEVQKARAARV